MIDLAEAKSVGLRNVRFFKVNAESLPFENNYFDDIICTNAFHHFSNPSKVLGEVYRALKPLGRVYILDGTADNFVMRLADGFGKRLEPEHVKLYSNQEYHKLFEDAGLSYVESKSVVIFFKIQVGEKPQ